MKEYIESFLQQNKEFKEPFEALHDRIAAGKTKVNSFVVQETLIIDDSWLSELEATVLSIEKIAKNPHTFIKEEREVVAIDKVKRIDNMTVRYLARNTADINTIDEVGNVKPKKLNTGMREIETAIYENRVVYALVLRLENYLRRANDEISDKINTIDSTTLEIDSNFNVDDAKFDCSIKLKMDSESENKQILARNQKLFESIKLMLRQIRAVKNTNFFKAVSKSKKVRPPIMRTNLFIHNYDYKNCFDCWRYLSQNNELDAEFNVSTSPIKMSSKYVNDIGYLVLAATLTLIDNDTLQKRNVEQLRKKKAKTRKFRIVRKVEYDPHMPRTLMGTNEEMLNQYYYEQMCKLLAPQMENVQGSVKNDDRRISLTFKQLYSRVSKVSQTVFENALEIDTPQENLAGTPIERKQRQLDRAKSDYAKYDVIIKEMKADLSVQSKKHTTRKKSIKKLEKEIETLLAREQAKAEQRAAKEAAEALRRQKLAEKKKKQLEEQSEERKALKLQEIQLKKQAREAEKQRLEAIRKEKEQKEQLRLAAIAKAEAEAVEKERAEKLRQEKEQLRLATQERKQLIKEEQAHLKEMAREEKALLSTLTAEEKQAKIEQERLAKEQSKAEQKRLEEEKAEQERIIKEKEEQKQRLAAEEAEQDRISKEEKAEKDRLEKERKAAEKAEKERLEQERKAEEKAEKQRLAAEKAEQDRIAKEQKAEQDRIEKEQKAEQERIEKEKRAQEREEQKRLEKERKERVALETQIINKARDGYVYKKGKFVRPRDEHGHYTPYYNISLEDLLAQSDVPLTLVKPEDVPVQARTPIFPKRNVKKRGAKTTSTRGVLSAKPSLQATKRSAVAKTDKPQQLLAFMSATPQTANEGVIAQPKRKAVKKDPSPQAVTKGTRIAVKTDKPQDYLLAMSSLPTTQPKKTGRTKRANSGNSKQG